MSEKGHVLYMEDNEGTARLLQLRLSRVGYEVDTVPDGEAGLERCAARAYDAILLDYNMPGMNGIQVLQRLATTGLKPPVIMLTGTGNERTAVDALKLGAFDYVVKDIDGIYLDLLPTVIEQALRNNQLHEDKRRAEKALQESEERFRLLFEHAPDAYYINDLDGIFIDGNRAAEQLIGYARGDMIGKSMLEANLLSEDQFPKAAELLYQNRQGISTGPDEFTLYAKDRTPVEIEVRTFPTLIHGTKMVLSIARDVTWRKQAEAHLKAHIEQLEVLHQIDDELTRKLDLDYVLEMACDTMTRISGANAGGVCIIQNGKFQQIHTFGYTEQLNPDQLSEKPSITLRANALRKAEWVQDVSTDPDYLALLEDTRSQITIPLLSQDRVLGVVSLETNQPDRFNAERYEFLKLIAARIAVAIENAQLYDASQKQIDELQNLYEQLSTLEQLKTDMVRIVSHDLRNPLSVVATSMHLMQRSLGASITENQQRYITQISQSIDRMKALTTDVLSLESIERLARGEVSITEVNFLELIRDIVESTRAQAERKQQMISLTSPDSPLIVRGNGTELHQAASNLIDNAIKYTPNGGRIDIVLEYRDGMLRFAVCDTGFGIPEAKHASLFQPFERVKTEETRSIEGTGLGLYIVKKIIERNNGRIIFQSEYGRGSTFGFELPQAEASG